MQVDYPVNLRGKDGHPPIPGDGNPDLCVRADPRVHLLAPSTWVSSMRTWES